MKTSFLLTLALVAITLAGSARADLVAYFPLNDGGPGTLALTADDVIDDASHPVTDAVNTGADTDTWEFNTVAHPIFDPTPGSKIVLSTGEGNRFEGGTQGIDLNDGFSWSAWVLVASSNLTDPGADSIIGTRHGGTWHKVETSSGGGVSNWNGTMANPHIADDTWHHIAYVGDLTDRKFYVDGVETASDDTVPTATFDNRFEFAGTSRFSEDITGFMSQVAVWNERLSLDDIADLAGGTAPPDLGGGGTLAGDLNNDGTVDQDDLNLVLGSWGGNGSWPGDPQPTNPVDQDDLNAVLGAWGQSLPPLGGLNGPVGVPEPSSVLMVVGAVALGLASLRKRG